MNTNSLVFITSWSAYLSAIAAILTFITGILFFTVGGAFGKINDISSVFQVSFMIPLALVLYRLLPDSTRTLGLIAALIGIGGMLAWTGILAGISYIVIVVAFLIKGQQNMVFYIGGLVLGISYPVWAIWLGRLIGTGALIVKMG